jgi:hypothetical protein
MACPLDKDILPVATSRTVLRLLSLTDLHDFQAYRTDPVVAEYQGWTAMADANATAFLAEMHASPLFVPGRWFQLGIALQAGELIGDIGRCARAKACRVGRTGCMTRGTLSDCPWEQLTGSWLYGRSEAPGTLVGRRRVKTPRPMLPLAVAR